MPLIKQKNKVFYEQGGKEEKKESATKSGADEGFKVRMKTPQVEERLYPQEVRVVMRKRTLDKEGHVVFKVGKR